MAEILLDREGNEIHLGDTVRLRNRLAGMSPDIENTAEVVTMQPNGSIGVRVAGYRSGHALGGILPLNPDGSQCAEGWNLPANGVIVVSPRQTAIIGENDDEATAAFRAAIASAPEMVIKEGRVYVTQRTSVVGADQILQRHIQTITDQFERTRDEYRRRTERLEQQLSTQIPMPTLSMESMNRNNIRIFGDSRHLSIMLGFHYNPQRISYRGQNFDLSPEDIQTLDKQILLHLRFSDSHLRQWVTRHNSDNHAVFQHYHSLDGNADCRGDVDPSAHQATTEAAIQFRDHYQSTLRIINGDSIGQNSPNRLPDFHSLLSRSTEVPPGDTWTSVTPEDMRGITRGCLVRIIDSAGVMPSDWVGRAIAKAASIFDVGDGQMYVNLEFLFNNSTYLHPNFRGGGDPPRHHSNCYIEVPLSSVERAPTGSRRQQRNPNVGILARAGIGRRR